MCDERSLHLQPDRERIKSQMEELAARMQHNERELAAARDAWERSNDDPAVRARHKANMDATKARLSELSTRYSAMVRQYGAAGGSWCSDSFGQDP